MVEREKDILLLSPSLRASSLASQIWVDLTRHQYGISALVSPMSLSGETSSGVAKCLLFLQAITSRHVAYIMTCQGQDSIWYTSTKENYTFIVSLHLPGRGIEELLTQI